MAVLPATITTELLEHADGRPIAYIDATAVAIFAYQRPDGTYVIDICTREDIRRDACVCFWTAAYCFAPALLPQLRKRGRRSGLMLNGRHRRRADGRRLSYSHNAVRISICRDNIGVAPSRAIYTVAA